MKKKILFIITISILVSVGFGYEKIKQPFRESSNKRVIQNEGEGTTQIAENREEKIEIMPKEKEEKKYSQESIQNTEKQSIYIHPKRYLTNINNLIEIHGIDENSITSVALGERPFLIKTLKGKTFIEVEAYTIPAGEYEVIIEGKTQEKITFWEIEEKNIFISNLSPKKIEGNKETKIVLQGEGFDKIISLQLSNNIVFTQANFEIINDRVMILTIPSGLEKGYYTMNTMSTYGIYNSELELEIY